MIVHIQEVKPILPAFPPEMGDDRAANGSPWQTQPSAVLVLSPAYSWL
jgi:hypothetical protein